MITFCSNSSVYGGTEQLYITLARELKKSGVPFKAVFPRTTKQWSFIQPFIDSQFLYDTLELNDIRDVIAPEDVMLIFCERSNYGRMNSRVLYWCVMPQMALEGRHLIEKIVFFPFEWAFVRRFLRENALYFMDDTSVRNIQRQLGFRIKAPKYLPIPAVASETNRYIENFSPVRDGLVLTYLGRAERWKVCPCAGFLKKVWNCVNFKEVHIITDNADRFRSSLAGLGVDLEHIIFHEGLYGEALHDFLTETSDLHFAMGTSALEAAGLGIPTIVIDPFFDPALEPHAVYRWVSEIRNHSLGELLTLRHRAVNGRPLEQLLKEFSQDRLSISEQCRNYVLQHHNPAVVCRRFVEAANGTQATFRSFFWINKLWLYRTTLYKWLAKWKAADVQKTAASA